LYIREIAFSNEKHNEPQGVAKGHNSKKERKYNGQKETNNVDITLQR
jgi:hypothetical protein